MSSNKYFITTPIYYVNFKPHIGTSYTTILTDVLCRAHRLLGHDVLLVTGSDEHSQNIADLAKAAKKSPRSYCDEIIPKFKSCWDLIGIQDYRFVRTSDEKHRHVVQTFWQRIYQRGDVYKSRYSGWYHTSDNRFLDDDEVPDSPHEHPRLKHLTEDAYFFRLSNYQSWLADFHRENPQFIVPDYRRNEMLKRLDEGVRDICISRTSTDWGIRLPWDSDHVFYVWVEALLAYVTGSGFDIEVFFQQTPVQSDAPNTELKEPLWLTQRSDLTSQTSTNYWPADMHVMAKDIPWFHAIIWPAMLKSAGVPLPKQLLVHGYWQFDGEKMSKSLGNVVDPYDAEKLVGADGLRYFLMREVPIGRDGSFSFPSLVKRFNYDLANDLGNLVHRTIGMLHKLYDGVVPSAGHDDGSQDLEHLRVETAKKALSEYSSARVHDALQTIWTLVRAANQHIDRVKPWELKKKPERKSEIDSAFYYLVNAILTVTKLAYPVIPNSANRFWKILGMNRSIEQTPNIDFYGTLQAGHRVDRSEVVFSRIDPNILFNEDATEKQTNTGPKKTSVDADTTHITIDDFSKMRLIVAEVRHAEPVKKTEKLLKLTVHDGSRERQIVSGIAKHYTADQLVGMRIVLVENLKPTKLRGELSEGMLLAAENSEGDLSLVVPHKEIAVGSKVG